MEATESAEAKRMANGENGTGDKNRLTTRTDGPAAGSLQNMAGCSSDDVDCHASTGVHRSFSSSSTAGASAHAVPAEVVSQPLLGCREAQAHLVSIPQYRMSYSPQHLLTETSWG